MANLYKCMCVCEDKGGCLPCDQGRHDLQKVPSGLAGEATARNVAIFGSKSGGWPCQVCGYGHEVGTDCPSGEATEGPLKTVNMDCPKCKLPIGWNPERGWFHMEDSNCNGVRNIPWPTAPAAPEGAAPPEITVPSLWRIDKCKRHEDYVESCAGCQEEILTVKTEQAYRAGYQRAVGEIAELQRKLLTEATGHMKTQASLKAANERFMAEQDSRKAAEGEVAELRAKLAEYTENRKVADCVDCGGSIWFREARIQDETGIYHPLCRIVKRAKAAEAQLHDAVGFILALNEETVLAGFPGGDRNQTLANVRAMRAQLKAAREALRKLISDKEPNGYPLWFNRAVHFCKECDSEDLCITHHDMAQRDFSGCEQQILEFEAALAPNHRVRERTEKHERNQDALRD